MHFETIWITTIFFLKFYENVDAIDDKLDFGGDHISSRSSIIKDQIVHKSSFVPAKQLSVSKLDDNNDFVKVGLVCTNGGCNTTKSTSNSENTVKTDVLVHIQTKVDLTQNKSQPEDDVPDIPIVIGTDDSNSDRNYYNDYNMKHKSIYVPDAQRNSYSNNGARINSDFSRDLNPSSISSNIYFPNTKVDSVNSFKDNGFDIDSGVNINIKSVPPVTVDITEQLNNMRTTKYMSNGIELSVPYFDTALHNHYYGENPPPQFAFYPRRTSIMNPVEFKIMTPSWKPSLWQNQFGPFKHVGAAPLATGKGCNCPNGQIGTEVNRYPNYNRRSHVSYQNTRSSINDPGSQINDKLAPLN